MKAADGDPVETVILTIDPGADAGSVAEGLVERLHIACAQLRAGYHGDGLRTDWSEFKTGVMKSALRCCSACYLGLFDGAHEVHETRRIDIAYGGDFEIVGVKTGDVNSGMFCLHWILLSRF